MKRNTKIAILGGGESGTGAAILALKKGYKVFLSDNGPIKDKYKSVLKNYEIGFEENGHTFKRILDADLVIKSPGIPDQVPVVSMAKEKGIPVISEIEFAGRFTKAKKICVTGSNGKTTTTLLLHHILENAGVKVGLAGNVGNSFAWQVAIREFDVYVLEISSFQLDGMFDFKAEIAILLNITPDHLDRYEGNFEKYARSKFRILQNQTENDALIYCYDDPVITQRLNKSTMRMQLYPFSLMEMDFGQGAYLKEENIVIKTHNKPFIMTLEQLALQGKHNIYNSMAAGIAARLMDIRNDSIKQSLSDFHNIPHRLEYVASVHGITFINDSKATNLNSTWYALEYLDKPIVWIAGGIDKGNDYSMISDLVKEKVKAIICLGVNNKKLFDAFGKKLKSMVETTTMEQAVISAYHIAKKGDVVLLSPACASFDLFENYEDRGNQFKEYVREL
ncbi:MAG: UDP-N-acetylmuramoyl-L-alanine--D-glutamate ligase [Chlorobi bacterium]|nr:UDP-N-acetylmuramoyl-L-alanine--D-glutamate ligase [Chlorobiota bacterium]